ncbi:cytochrome c biogenesis CcdA family protein [Paenibacillus radicis (ex Gao et al. 2016)]|uniref:Cytochrome C biogenesis protein CcdA n=1 Tax=Paenibacillus radicis (ex Gao et al. 2016) TaxID=1737354 RepID=A0A917HP41_9BACL|nr:cytochrome C biogenesis protein CcdA [Paenibacillus radicis (ex Gao et al. 2016)]
MAGDPLFLFGVFAAGLLSFFAPCILPLLPVYVAYLSGTGASSANSETTNSGSFRLRPRLIIRTLLFVLGLSTVFIFLGFGFGTIGTVITSSRFIAVCGAIVILFGIYQTGWIKLSFLEREKKISSDRITKKGYIGAFLLGLTFSFGWTPCIGPVLAAILSIAAGEGSPAYGGFLMLIYTLGLAIPFLLMSVFSDFILTRIRRLYKFMGVIKVVSGCILILMGILLMTDQLNTIVVWFQ